MARGFEKATIALVCLLSVCVAELKVFEECAGDGACPELSMCTYRGCDGRRCVCKEGTLPVVDHSRCVNGTSLGATCDSNSVCIGAPFSECFEGVCRCKDGYHNSTFNSRSVCFPNNKIGSDVRYSTCRGGINDTCPFDLACNQNKCACPSGQRPATSPELAAWPFQYYQCRPNAFELGINVDVAGPECKNQTLTSSLPPTTLTTTTTPTTILTTTSTPKTTSTPTTATSTTPTTTTTTQTTTTSTTPTTTTSPTPIPTTTTATTTTTTTTPTTTTTTPATTTTTPTTTTTTTPTTKTTTATPTVTTTTTTPSTTTTTTQYMYTTTTTIPSTTTTTTPSTTTTTSTTPSTTTPTTTSPKKATTLPTTKTTITTTTTSTTTLPKTTPSFTTTTTPIPTITTTGSSLNSTCTDIGNTSYCCAGSPCPENAECVEDSCMELKCRCELGYANNPDRTQCWKLSALGESCQLGHLCQGPFTQCSEDGLCECKDGYEFSDTGRWCRLKKTWFIDFPLEGEECYGGFFSECYLEFEQECRNGRCHCKEGLRALDVSDRYAMFPSISQCRNVSYPSGKRDKDLCRNQMRTSTEADVYDRAKAKIRKIQGAIIGGCVGAVALLGILIGVFVLIRWKRKGRRRNILDSSSTASTDGQSSRYSFKIPRPFATYDSRREYDSTQIIYPKPFVEHDNRATENHPDVLDGTEFHDAGTSGYVMDDNDTARAKLSDESL